jgi:uncharacterized protein (TIGR00106 family)
MDRREVKMVIAEISVTPVGTQTPSASEYVARAIRSLRQDKDISYELTAMGTLIEGELDKVLGAARRMHESLFDDGVKRVVTTIRIDDRRDKELSMIYKVQSVMQKLGE